MIDVRELRIGSHVLCNGKWERVRGLDEDNGLIIRFPAEYVLASDVEPIAITEELLRELGFECIARYKESWWQRGDKRIKIRDNYVEVTIYQGFCDTTWRCQYLHELEAFVYLTTKTELTKD